MDSSGMYSAFANNYGFQHLTSSPIHPQGTERGVQIIKNLLRKAVGVSVNTPWNQIYSIWVVQLYQFYQSWGNQQFQIYESITKRWSWTSERTSETRPITDRSSPATTRSRTPLPIKRFDPSWTRTNWPFLLTKGYYKKCCTRIRTKSSNFKAFTETSTLFTNF